MTILTPFQRLRAQFIDGQLVLRGEGFPNTARRLRAAFDRFEQTLTGEGVFEALCPDDERLFAELPEAEQRRYAAAAARLRGELAGARR